eukprot:jgi/Chrzof1/14612/Cz09g09130.t1
MARLFQTHERMFMTSPFAAADDKPSTEKPGPLGGDLPGGDRRMPGAIPRGAFRDKEPREGPYPPDHPANPDDTTFTAPPLNTPQNMTNRNNLPGGASTRPSGPPSSPPDDVSKVPTETMPEGMPPPNLEETQTEGIPPIRKGNPQTDYA